MTPQDHVDKLVSLLKHKLSKSEEEAEKNALVHMIGVLEDNPYVDGSPIGQAMMRLERSPKYPFGL